MIQPILRVEYRPAPFNDIWLHVEDEANGNTLMSTFTSGLMHVALFRPALDRLLEKEYEKGLEAGRLQAQLKYDREVTPDDQRTIFALPEHATGSGT